MTSSLPRFFARRPVFTFVLLLLFCSSTVFAAGSDGGHHDPLAGFLLFLALVVMGAAVGRWVSVKVHQPPVLGELLMGVIAGNIGYHILHAPLAIVVMNLNTANEIFLKMWSSGLNVTEIAQGIFTAEQLAPGGSGERLLSTLTGPGGGLTFSVEFALFVLSQLGVLLLLFMVGLENDVAGMMKVGGRAAAVGVVGTIAPIGLGLLASWMLIPDVPMAKHLFIAATLCATSVGITARVYRDMHRLTSRDARIVLGAAVIDDILALLVLAVVTGIVTTGSFDPYTVARISILSFIFLGVVIGLGGYIVRAGIGVFKVIDRSHVLLLYPLCLMLILSWLAAKIGLASIIGAFAAGLIITTGHLEDEEDERNVTEIMQPIESLLAPIFFVLMGMQVNLATFVDPSIIGLAAALTVVAIISKVVAGYAAGPGADKLSIGFGMMPRGEVGLIFASIGKSIGVVNESVYSALVVVIIVSTMLAPPAMKWSMARFEKKHGYIAPITD